MDGINVYFTREEFMSFKKLFVIGVVAAVLVACGDDDSDFATHPDGKESSFAKSSSSSGQSSSSVALATPCRTDSTDICEYGELVDERDDQTYKTVVIGTQTWMAENLNFETENSYCYNDSAEYCDRYGRLYPWAAAMKACPSGWHLPDSTEWSTLFTAVGDPSSAGKELKSTSGWNGGGNGTDPFGFSALPAGYRHRNGSFSDDGVNANFWSSSMCDGDFSYHIYFLNDFDLAYVFGIYKDNAYSVRCVKD